MSVTMTPLAGAGAGLLVWTLSHDSPFHLPGVFRFVVALLGLVSGMGAVPVHLLRRGLSLSERLGLAAAAGVGVAAPVSDVLFRLHLSHLTVPLSFAAGGAVMAIWRREHSAGQQAPSEWRGLALTVIPVVALALATAIPRVSTASGGVAVYGDYDTRDLAYYGAIAGELTHTRPPRSPFLSGHPLVYPYYPQVIVADAARSAAADLLRASLQWAWPVFAAIAAGAAFLLCRRLGSVRFAVLSVLFMFTAEGLAGVLAMAWPASVASDPIVWSSIFLAPSATWLYYNTWGPALPVLITVLYCGTRLRAGWRWPLAMGLAAALLPMTKFFAYIVVVPAMGLSALASWRRDRPIARRFAGAAAVAVIAALPALVFIVANRAESRSYFQLEWLALPRWMLIKLGVTAGDLTAVTLFAIGGLGARVVAAPSVWRAVRLADPAGGNATGWMLLAWFAAIGCLLPCVAIVEPRPNAIQTYVVGLLCLWPFAIRVLMPEGAVASWRRITLIAVVFAVSAWPTAHYLRAVWTAASQPPAGVLTYDDLAVVEALRRLPGDATLMLHDDPDGPSLLSIASARRTVVGWSDIVGWADTGEVLERSRDVRAFYQGDLDPEAGRAMIRRYGITHVVERLPADRIRADVLASLKPILLLRSARLYEVPAEWHDFRADAPRPSR
jgi:hypothetical protein